MANKIAKFKLVTEDSTGLMRYDAMLKAIAECHHVDEVKDMRDKALALEAYAKQARNLDAELQASEIRLRAERQCGFLLKQMEMNKGVAAGGERNPSGNVVRPGDDAKTLADMGLTKSQSQRFQQLADVPDEEFEQHFNMHETICKPSTNGILRKHKEVEKPVINPLLMKRKQTALKLWGLARDLRELSESVNLDEVIPIMSNIMQRDIPPALEKAIPWLIRLQEGIKK